MRRLHEDFLETSKLPLGVAMAEVLSQRPCPADLLMKVTALIKSTEVDLSARYNDRSMLRLSVLCEMDAPFRAIIEKADERVINGQDPDDGWSALMQAVHSGKKDRREQLIISGADPRLEAYDGKTTAITLAQARGAKDVADELQAVADRLNAEDALKMRSLQYMQ